MDENHDEPLLSATDYDNSPQEPSSSGGDRRLKKQSSSWLAESLEKGRARSSVLSLVSCALGTGVLTLPSAFSESGLLVGIIITLCAATLNG